MKATVFLGVTVPNIRAIAKLHKDISIEEIRELIQSEWHEVRLCALIIMVEKSKEKRRSFTQRAIQSLPFSN